METSKSAKAIELMLIQQMVSAVALLRLHGYTTATFEDLKNALFLGLTKSFQSQNLSKKSTAALLGLPQRTFYDLLKRATEQIESSERGADEELYYEILLFINKNPDVTRIELFDHFDCYGDEGEVRELQVQTNLDLLKAGKKIWESGCGDATSYNAPCAELPDGDNIDVLETSIADHLSAISQAIISRCEALLFDEKNGSFILTTTIDCDKDSSVAVRLSSLLTEFNGQLYDLFQESEAQKANRKSGDSVTIYLGHVWKTEGDE